LKGVEQPIVDNDQINEKNVCLVIKGGKLTAKCLATAMKLFLALGKYAHKKLTTPENCESKGKQTVIKVLTNYPLSI